VDSKYPLTLLRALRPYLRAETVLYASSRGRRHREALYGEGSTVARHKTAYWPNGAINKPRDDNGSRQHNC
jgi:hypothetical protein